jgi:hydrogenase maturation factor
VQRLAGQVFDACRALGISVVGGHTEITAGLERPILAGTLIGEADPQRLVTPRGLRPGNRLLLTKGVPIEGTALLARELRSRLAGSLSPAELEQAATFLHDPGISILPEARLAVEAGKVTAMHDPTEGGLLGALWELAEAAGCTLRVDPQAVPVPPLAQRICTALGLDPLATIASGALLLSCPPEDSPVIQAAIRAAGIACTEIGAAEAGPPELRSPAHQGGGLLRRPEVDEVARIFAQ